MENPEYYVLICCKCGYVKTLPYFYPLKCPCCGLLQDKRMILSWILNKIIKKLNK